MQKKYYLTTPLYYVNSNPHIGHAYTTMAADILARHLRATQRPVFLQTGTDEHGSNIEKTAAEKNIPPKQWCDDISDNFRTLWKTLGINYDYFIRTTDKQHEEAVQAVFEKLIKTGDIYKSEYEGLYCKSCEAFYTESELQDGKCPVHHRPVEAIKEESYFFRLSKYQDALLKYYEEHPDFLSPSYRAREIINFVKAGLTDLSVSRTKVAWGIQVKSDPAHTVYVWFDALLNYITGRGYNPDHISEEFKEYWPADLHLVGKEIFRFHGVIWPAMLMALGLELPKKVYAHGWWTVNGDKMSKSTGNFIRAEDVVADYGLDAFRYFTFREVTFGQDGDFSMEAFRRRYNSDLANDLGNLFSRIINLVNRNLDERLPEDPSSKTYAEFAALTDKINRSIEDLQFSDALETIWNAISTLNKIVAEKKPWEMAKKAPEALPGFLNEMVWCLRLIAGWIEPFMPATSASMKVHLGAKKAVSEGEKIQPLFPRKAENRPEGK